MIDKIKAKMKELINSPKDNDVKLFSQYRILLMGYNSFNESTLSKLREDLPELAEYYIKGSKLRK